MKLLSSEKLVSHSRAQNACESSLFTRWERQYFSIGAPVPANDQAKVTAA
jgi:hypothetical protein